MTRSSVVIREVSPSDVPEVVNLIRNVLAEFGLSFGVGSSTDQDVTHLPRSYVEQGGAFWVAMSPSGNIIGTCGVFPIDATTYELRKMYLAPTARGQGVASLLLDQCISFARSNGRRRLVLDTTHEMERAIAFYEKNGFVRDDTQIRGARCSRGYACEL